jgi:putative ABC transport system substrate-binding protein
MGLSSSLARPDGNVTGISTLSQELTGKRLELLKETFPKVSRVAVLVRVGSGSAASWLKEMEVVSQALGFRLRSLEVRSPGDLDTAFQTGIRERAEALVELPNPLFHGNRSRIAEFATKNRLPSIFHSRDFVDAGGLMCYGENHAVSYRRVVSYVDRILKGAKPADLPVELPRQFELVINLKTAKQIGLTVPPNVLARADKVIR